MADAPRESVESWKNNPWSKLPTWAKWTIGIVGALILLGIGAAVGSGEESKLEDEVAQVEQERDRAEREAQAVLSRKVAILGRASQRANHIVGSARAEDAKLSSQLANTEAQLDSTKEELVETEGSLVSAEETAAKSTITDGTWQAEVDYITGTYRAPGGESCYWAMLNSANPGDIAENEIGAGPQLAEITSPYFQTKGCGTWERVE